MQNQFIFIFLKLKLLHHFIFCQTANGQVRSGYVYNWTSWLDDYGFGKCIDKAKCNMFPDGRPFPQSNDWRRKSYVYVWHTMGEIQVYKFACTQDTKGKRRTSKPTQFVSSFCPRPVLWDVWRLFLQCDHQYHQHPSGGRGHGSHGLQETRAQEVQPPLYRQRRLLCHRWEQQIFCLYSFICLHVSAKQRYKQAET